MTRKEIDALAEFVKTYRAKGLAWLKWNEAGEISSSYAKFLTEEENEAVKAALSAKPGDLLLIVADAKNDVVFDALGALRRHCAKKLGLLDPYDFRFLWVTEFPLLEYSEEDGRFYAKHHPFTAPMDEDLAYLDSDPGRVRAKAYDIVLNGKEIGGGSIRIHEADVQERMFEVLGISKEDADYKFGFIINAFKFGAPPHGGLAFGFDRVCALFGGQETIRDYIAFPKNNQGRDVMIDSPSYIDQEQMDELCLNSTAPKQE